MIILLVEDIPKQSEFIQKALERASFTVDLAADGTVALEKISVRDYDLIILDLDLPKVRGTEILQALKKMEIKSPVLILTAQDDLHSKVMHLDLGADDYLTKPFALEELISRVRALLRRPENVLPNIIEHGNLKINFRTREVAIQNRLIQFTRNEFRFIEYLVRNSGRICTPLMIKEHVWGYDNQNQSNIVEALAYSIRKKLGVEHKNLIQTVKNFGYKIK